jgi:cytochrome b
VPLILAAYITVEVFDQPVLHLWLGYAILALLLFRVVWGFVGSDTARFRRFVASPRAALRYLPTLRRREPDTQVGHNAAGGWMVLIMLLLLAVQVGTGLFASNDAGTKAGPLAKYLSRHDSDLLSAAHSVTFDLLVAAIVLHVAVIGVYALVKRQDLVRPMITGKKRLPAATRAPRMASPLLALLILALAAAATFVVATRM